MNFNNTEIDTPFEICDRKNISDELNRRLYGTLIISVSDDICVKTTRDEIRLHKDSVCYIRPMTAFAVSGTEMRELRIDIHTLEMPTAYFCVLYPIIGEAEDGKDDIGIYTGEKAAILTEAVEQLSGIVRKYSYAAYISMLKIIDILKEDAESASSEKTFDNITVYIDTHADSQLEAAELAGMCGMSYPNFAKHFHERYGRSCKGHITHVRSAKAKRMLISTELDISEIAAECGFFDSSHFIRTYKKKYGVTPNRDRDDPI